MKDRTPDGAVREGSPRRASLCAAGLLTLAVLVAYANSWSVPFLFDDVVTIVENPTIRGESALVLSLAPAEHTGVGGRPLAHLSLVINQALTGETVTGFHGFNLAIHLLAGLALFGFVRRTLLQTALAVRWHRDAWWFALAVAGLWLLHPVQTESVTYISQRTESLMGLCYFLTLYCFVRGAQPSENRGWLLLSVTACFAGMASKEVMVTAPVVVLLYDYAFIAGSFREAWKQRRIFYLGMGASWVLLAYLLRGLGGRGVGFGVGGEWWHTPLHASRAIVTYLSLAVWPHPLVFDYGTNLGTPGWPEVLCAGLVAGLAALAGFGLRRCPPLGFLAAWFLITLAPTSSVVPIPLQPLAENRVYLPLAGVIVAGVCLFYAATGRANRAAGIAVAVALGALTLARNSDYRSAVAIWADTVAKRPENSRAHHNLGNALRDANQLPEAERSFKEALRLNPAYAEAEAALGGVVARQGRLDEAIARCRKALQLDPRTAEAHNNLGGALWQKGDLTGAIAEYEAALRLRPRFAEAYANLAGLYVRCARVADAIAASQAALRIKPGLPEARFALGVGFGGTGRTAEALAIFQQLVREKPDYLDARLNLAIVLHQLGRRAEAIPVYREVLRRNPNLADAHVKLGLALRLDGMAGEAAAHFETALRLDPNSAQARSQLEEIRGRGPDQR